MKIAFNPSTVAALTSPPDNKDITFDLRGQNIFARGVKFQGTDTNTWRTIKVGGVSIGNKTLNFMPTGDIYVKTADQDSTSTDDFDIGFGLAWYNVSTGKYEYE